jgi:transcriptional regulator with XRE-family HTH domain
VHVPEHIRAGLSAMMDDPDHVAKELASQIGCSRSTLYRILEGEVGIRVLRRLARAFPNLIDPNADTLGHRRR